MNVAILKDKSGVTILEGVIALGLLALVMGGAFGVLLSTSRQTTQPDMYEEMSLAVEKASEQLKEYLDNGDFGSVSGASFSNAVASRRMGQVRDCICGSPAGGVACNPHDLSCFLPPICDINNGSSFTWTVDNTTGSSFAGNWPTHVGTVSWQWEGRTNPQMYQFDATEVGKTLIRDSTSYPGGDRPSVGIRFNIVCNGYQL